MSIINIEIPLPEIREPEHDKKLHPDGGSFLYGVELAQQIIQELKEKELIAVGKFENGTCTTIFFWEGSWVERVERNMHLKLSDKAYQKFEADIARIVEHRHPYRTISANVSCPTLSLFQDYNDWVRAATRDQREERLSDVVRRPCLYEM